MRDNWYNRRNDWIELDKDDNEFWNRHIVVSKDSLNKQVSIIGIEGPYSVVYEVFETKESLFNFIKALEFASNEVFEL